MRTGFVTDPVYLQHRDEQSMHPECPERLRIIQENIKKNGFSDDLVNVKARMAEEALVLSCHTHSHIERMRQTTGATLGYLDADTYINRFSWEAALTACGGVMAGVDAVMSAHCDHVFCAVRPPGHHAESGRAMGFCLFNNIAVGARYAQKVHGLNKIFILDWDVHHGNGTQEIFYQDATVFYFSVHQFPLYPGTGKKEETGKGLGLGYTYNVPLNAGSGDREYRDVFEKELQNCLDFFKPDLIMISAGFDAHRLDPLAQMNVSTDGFTELTRIVKDAALRYSKGRLISVLEGGYHLQALADSVGAHLRVLMHD